MVTPIEESETSPTWLGFTLDTPDDVCERRFIARFGQSPRIVASVQNMKLAGPIEAGNAALAD